MRTFPRAEASRSVASCHNFIYHPSFLDTTKAPYYGTRISKHVSSPNVVIPPELTLLGYDLGGRLVQADNRFAEISRGYYPNGALKGDTTRYRSHDLTYEDGFALTTALTYTYDLSGRRLSRVDNMGGRQLYAYNSVGQLESTTDSLNAGAKVAFTFAYDSLGRLVTQASPTASTTATWTYDVEGRPLTRSEEGFSDVLRYDARGKRIGVQGQLLLSGGYAGVSLMAYDGLGQLSASTNSDRERRTTDAVALDAFGNVKARHANKLTDSWNDGEQLDSTSYDGSRMTGRFGKFFPSKTFPTKFADSIMVEYDNAGNVRHQQLIRREWVTAGNERRANNGHSWTWNFYDADNRLRFAQVTRYAPTNIKETTFEDYWYDALGRRIAVRTRADSIKCYPAEPTYECIQPHTRTVWDGDQVLVEYRNNGDWSLPDAFVGGGGYHSSLAEHYGKVRYMNTGAIDAPLAVWKNDAAPRVLHRNWRGSVAGATYVDGDSLDTGTVWPAAYTDIFFRSDANQTIPQPNRWLGSLVLDQRDATGNLYRRNRYYDPVTGRFTQEDPIGLAGGMNLYGYAAGDPVNKSDPFGLCGADESDTTTVEVCQARADLPGNVFNVQHMWIRTAQGEWGLGQEGGGVPGEGDYVYADNLPFWTKAEITDHAGRGNQAGATCRPVPNVSASCVNSMMRPGAFEGRFQPVPGGHNCQTIAKSVLTLCSRPPVQPDATRVSP